MLAENIDLYSLQNFSTKTLKIQSEILKDNPLGDPTSRRNPCLIPIEKGAYKAVLYLSGFSGNGAKSFNFRSFERNLIQEIDRWTSAETIKPHCYLFLDAWTFWGGSQFINSVGCGNYESYILEEVVSQFEESLKAEGYEISEWAVLGGSSGGYGALHLCSRFPKKFKHCLAIAPDSDFELSLRPEIHHALPFIESWGGIAKIAEDLKSGELSPSKRHFHTVMNVIGMAACYSKISDEGQPVIPLSKEGDFNEELWSEWLKKDPLHFLADRTKNLNALKTLFLSVGEFDQFLLQFGARKIRKLLQENKIDFTYEEFQGNHFDLGKRRKKALSML